MNGYTIYYLTINILSTLLCIVFNILILNRFFRKKTVGTLLLWTTYFSTTVGEILLTTSFFLTSFSSNPEIYFTTETLTLVAYIFFGMNIVFIYAFANRLLLKDNHFVMMLFIIGFTFSQAFPLGLTFKNIFVLRDPTLYTKRTFGGSNFVFVFPEISYVLIGVLLIITVIALSRIVIKAIRVERGTDDPIAKKAFQFIWQGTIIWYFGYVVMFSAYYMIPFFSTNAIASVINFSLRLIFSNIIGFAMLYIGWIMPDWFKRRFRKKAWVVQVHTGKVSVPKSETTKSYISSEHTQNVSAYEVSDK
ncbi:MAG: hypothetical protein GF308_06655 [Candidatus Heimdallarchaeota archaeon]|nr:hypothetical protein [Candidatus Heimdallarchaeota archaeon]